jgi:hypothetical protein
VASLDIPSRYPSGSRTASRRPSARTGRASGAIGGAGTAPTPRRELLVDRRRLRADLLPAATPPKEGRKMNTTTVRPSVRTTGMNATLRWGLAAIAVGMILGALLAP